MKPTVISFLVLALVLFTMGTIFYYGYFDNHYLGTHDQVEDKFIHLDPEETYLFRSAKPIDPFSYITGAEECFFIDGCGDLNPLKKIQSDSIVYVFLFSAAFLFIGIVLGGSDFGRKFLDQTT